MFFNDDNYYAINFNMILIKSNMEEIDNYDVHQQCMEILCLIKHFEGTKDIRKDWVRILAPRYPFEFYYKAAKNYGTSKTHKPPKYNSEGTIKPPPYRPLPATQDEIGRA
eukprot:328939_1